MGPTLVLSATDGPHVGFMNLAIRDIYSDYSDNPNILRPKIIQFSNHMAQPCAFYHDLGDGGNQYGIKRTIINLLAPSDAYLCQ